VNASATTTTSIAVSSSGQYQVVGGNGYIYYSVNYGQSWTLSTAVAVSYSSVSISSNGQYVGATTSANKYYLSVTPYAPYLYATMGATGITSNPLVYNTVTKQVTYSTAAKTFIIDHPTDTNSFLVHACLEGPEVGVYYRGTGRVEFGHQVATVRLPSYVEQLAHDFTVQLSGSAFYTTTEVVKNEFQVVGECGTFDWCVYGKRKDLIVEPLKETSQIVGSGPYTYLR
jgi:hypothetical protein